VVAPGADPAAIRLHYEGTDAMKVDDAGALVLTTGAGTLTETPETCYQEIDGRRITVAAMYHVVGDRDVTFSVGAYDPSSPLVIDPTLVYSTWAAWGITLAIVSQSTTVATHM
jgi:large repetitive protein